MFYLSFPLDSFKSFSKTLFKHHPLDGDFLSSPGVLGRAAAAPSQSQDHK